MNTHDENERRKWIAENLHTINPTSDFDAQGNLIRPSRNRPEQNERRKEQGHEPWPGTPGAQNEDVLIRKALEAAASVFEDMDAVSWNEDSDWTSSSYSGVQDMVTAALERLDAARGVQPAAQTPCPCEVNNMLAPCAPQEGAAEAEQVKCAVCGSGLHFDCGGIVPWLRRTPPSPAQEKPETASVPEIITALVFWLEGSLNCKTHLWEPDQRHIAEETIKAARALTELRQEWPLALTQASVTKLQRQLAQAQEQFAEDQKLIGSLKDTRQQLIAEKYQLEAACKAKDEALMQASSRLGELISDGNRGTPERWKYIEDVRKALAIQPSSGLPESSPSFPTSR